ncbi:hypothetical protein QUB63_21025 [Microcoleus sp. ARI1-B5]|uniref:hypothetical protein n=1 Tax=unclassified Microcoleus TaxID=2642155 RepID=UPI002FD3405E
MDVEGIGNRGIGNWEKGNWEKGNWEKGNWEKGNWEKGNWAILPLWHSPTLPISPSGILPFSHSPTLPLSPSPTLPFCHNSLANARSHLLEDFRLTLGCGTRKKVTSPMCFLTGEVRKIASCADRFYAITLVKQG